MEIYFNVSCFISIYFFFLESCDSGSAGDAWNIASSGGQTTITIPSDSLAAIVDNGSKTAAVVVAVVSAIEAGKIVIENIPVNPETVSVVVANTHPIKVDPSYVFLLKKNYATSYQLILILPSLKIFVNWLHILICYLLFNIL